ncbi:MAG: sugar lactone lactonase YvrE [Sediminicola sp.]|jgi:sugar lactone lactonase YvrE
MKITSVLFMLLWTTLVCSQAYDIYVSDAGNFEKPPWQIVKYDQNGWNPTVFINTHLNWPQDILFMEDSKTVLISNLGSGTITKHHAQSGAYISDFANEISGPTRTKIGPDGLLYVLQWAGNGTVLRFDLDGNSLGEFTKVGVPQSIGLDWDVQGNLYVSSYKEKTIRKYDAEGNDMGIFIDNNLMGPTNIWFDADGDLLVSDYNGTSIKRFDANGIFKSNFITGLKNSEGIVYTPEGNILIGNGNTHSVKLFDNKGNYIKDIIANGSGKLLTPNAVVIRHK